MAMAAFAWSMPSLLRSFAAAARFALCASSERKRHASTSAQLRAARKKGTVMEERGERGARHASTSAQLRAARKGDGRMGHGERAEKGSSTARKKGAVMEEWGERRVQ
eukprot:3008531-Prymnesium_polylepis.2